MIRLPNVLNPYGELLALFREELSAPLGDLSRRLAALIGQFPHPQQWGDGEPDGYDGVSRRGRYERLLLSEWLLAEEAPEEFLRRASCAEHGFLHLARRAQTGTRRSIVLLDSGPSQLGGPRIVQLAALILFVSRAEEAGVEISIGLIQDAVHTVHSTLDSAVIKAVLEGRSATEPNATSLDGWYQILNVTADDELWTVGGKALVALASKQARLLLLRDALERSGPSVIASVADRRGTRDLTLALPNPRACENLLSRPLRIRNRALVKYSHSTDLTGGVVFSPSGARVMVRLKNGGIATYPVPAVPRATSRKPKETWPTDSDRDLVPLAVGWRRRQPIIVKFGDDRLVVVGHFADCHFDDEVMEERRGASQRRVIEVPLPVELRDRPDNAPLGRAFFVLVDSEAKPHIFFEDKREDGSARLLFISAQSGTSFRAGTVPGDLRGLHYFQDRLFAATTADQGGINLSCRGPSTPGGNYNYLATTQRTPVLFAPWTYAFLTAPRELLIRVDSQWHENRCVLVDENATLIGLTVIPRLGDQAAVVAHAPSGDRIVLIGDQAESQIDLTAHRPEGAVILSSKGATAAWISETGDLVVHDLSTDEQRFRVSLI